MNDVFIVEPLRTPIGKYGGVLAKARPDDMAAHCIRSVTERSKIPLDVIDDIILGCANQAGEDNRNIARMAGLLAGLPYSIPGVTVNRLCASSLEAIIQAARAIRSGDAEVIIAGGVESMSRAPYSLPKNSSGAALFGNITAYDTALGWRYPNPLMEKMFPLESMGETAENIAERWNISRREQDEFAFCSHQKASASHKERAEEIAPFVIHGKKGEQTIIADDEQPRPDTTVEKLAKLSPAFRKDGSVTAGNSSSLNDGAAAALIVGENAVKRYNLKPLARFVASGASGVDPRIMGIGPVEATRKCLMRAGLSVKDIGLVELNEAFAAQSLACMRDLGLDADRVNILGGAIALGHPLGMSGVRIAGSLVRSMLRNDVKYGLATLCIGVGQGLAAIFEKV